MAMCSKCQGSGKVYSHPCSACGGLGYFEAGQGADDFVNGRSSRGCLAVETEILTPTGWIALSKLARGDRVIAVTLEGASVEAVIDCTTKPKMRRIWEITTRDASQPLRCSVGHPFLTVQGWRNAWMLRTGDYFWKIDEAGCRTANEILSVRRLDEHEEVQNLQLKTSDSFITRAAVTHRTGFLRVFSPSPFRARTPRDFPQGSVASV